jgi:K(+)-stimulated pyrophosphate-energized sodium pump
MNWTVNFFELVSLAVGVLGLVLSFVVYRGVVARPMGTPRMIEIAGAIREGSFAYLKAQALYLVPFVGVVFILLCFTKLGFETALAYLMGSFFSLLAGFIGMTAATHANVRTAQAASENKPAEALEIAFDGGSVMGLAVASLGILGMIILFFWYGVPGQESPLIGFGMGASSIALFARVGGGIYTKAADVGADLVGKVEANIPEDDPRNPGVIADNVGDNVGDVAGMGADIFESYVACIIGALALGATASAEVLLRLTAYEGDQSTMTNYRIWLMLTPIMIAVLGTVASYIAMKSMRFLSSGDPGAALRKVGILAPAIFMALLFGFLTVTPVNMNLWVCALVGTLAGIGIGAITEYYTGSKPVFQIIEGAKTGPATGVIAGIALGFQSVAAPVLMVAAATFLSFEFGGFYGSALAGIAMLATVGITMTIDAYGPIADNAGGISEMSGLGKETRAITDKLDQLGNTTAAIGKGFAIGSAGLAALSLFGAYVESFEAHGHKLELSLIDPHVIVGIFIGATLPGLIVAFTMRSVGRAAGQMVTEIRRQFREIPGLLEGKEGVKPEVARCVQISTKAALSEMRLPGIVAIAAPVLVGFLFGAKALGGLLLGVTVVGMVVGIFMSNAGGAWDNAKKFIEQGMVEGEKKGGDLHRAAVVGDTVGDPCKDTSGPSLNILIKLVSMLSLLIAPLLAS